jgi:hypothetical protein
MLSSQLMTDPSKEADSTGQPFPVISPSWRIILFCLSAALLYGLGIFWGLPSILSPASDSPAPLSPLNWIARYRDTSVSQIYPPVHQLLCLAAYGVVLLGWKIAGGIGAISKVYPYGFHNPTLVFSSLLLVTNLLSLAMGLGILVCMRSFRLGRPAGTWYAMSLLGLSGVFAYYARVGNLDVPYMFWFVLSWLMVWRYIFSKPDRKLLVLAAIAGALAIGTKDQAYGLEFGLCLVLLFVSPERAANAIRARLKTAFLFGGTLSLVYAITAIAVNPWRWWAHVNHWRVFLDSGFEQTFPQWIIFLRAVLQASHILSPGGLVLGIVGLGLLLRRGAWRQAAVLFIPPVAYYATVIMKLGLIVDRYVLVPAFALALCAGFAGSELLDWSRRSRITRYAAVALLAAVAADQVIESLIPVTYCQLLDVRREAASELPSLVAPGSPLLMVRMNSFNIPDSRVYDRYWLMLPPEKELTPPSSHGEHVLKPYDPQYRYVLAGSTLDREVWPPVGRLVRQWTYLAWIKSRVHVPAVYELSLYERGR